MHQDRAEQGRDAIRTAFARPRAARSETASAEAVNALTRRALVGSLPAAAPWILRAQPTRRPNVLFLFTDDQRADTIHALGNPVIRTPNLDRLARSAFVFRNCYVQGSNVAAVCLPSRNMLLSGRSYFRFSKYASGDDPNLPDALRAAGYETYHHGKRGNVALLIEKKFEHSRYTDDQAERTSGEPGREIVDAAIEFLRRRSRERPFFMYLAFGNPHDPRVAAPRYLGLYRREQIPLPRNFMPLHPFDNGEMTVRDELLASWPRTPEEIRKHLHDYYAVISALDFHIGRLLDCLRRLRLFDETLILFSSDNGLALGSHGLMGKQSLYEHSSKVPFFLTGPGVPRGSSHALTYLTDVFPTLLDWLELPIPEGLDGISHKPVILRRAAGMRSTLFTSYRECQRAVRDDRWKLIRYPHINKTQLFDLHSDPDELHDLAFDPAQSSRIGAMMLEIERWQKRLGDTTPLTSATPRKPEWNPPQGDELQRLRAHWKM